MLVLLRRLRGPVIVLALAMSSPVLMAQDTQAPPATTHDDRIDADTGRDTRIYPPDPLFEHKHFRLELTVPDMSRSAFTAIATLTLAPIAFPQSSLTLNAGPTLKFKSISFNGSPVEFAHDGAGHRVTIQFPRPLTPGEVAEVRMTYAAARAGGRGAGLTWSKDDPRSPEVDFMMHAQGEAESNHLWFPCHDFPNVRVSTELIVTVPEPYEAVSNGRLLGVSRSTMHVPASGDQPAEDRRMATYHWLQEKPHVYYLVTMVIGRFDVVNVGGPQSARPGLWMPVYGPLGSAERIRMLFANTPEMMAHFERLFDTAFPWDKYAQIICRDFDASAMENTSASTFNEFAARGRRTGALDVDIAHELVHQWFGDLVTCKSWEHVWLNEGWASIGEALWAEHKRGPKAYHATMTRFAATERARSCGRTRPADEGMVSARYDDPNDRFVTPDNVYSKGGVILHMLRLRLGDALFFQAAREYLREYAFRQVETDDLRKVFERVSGLSLEQFFDQWAKRPGLPSLDISYDWAVDGDGPAGALTIDIEQTQTIDGDNPAYVFDLPVRLTFSAEGQTQVERTVDVRVAGRTASLRVNLDSRPSEIQVDPRLTVLSANTIVQPLVDSIRQLGEDRPAYVRYQAARALAASDNAAAREALRALVIEDLDECEPDEIGLVLSEFARQALGLPRYAKME